jgi:hypothetical protein
MPNTGGTIGKARPAARFAAWLALFAAGIQALIPLLVAVELSFAASFVAEASAPRPMTHEHHGDSAAAHHHDAHRDDGAGRSAPATGHGLHCPLCIALHASNAFIAPVVLPPALPFAEGRVTETAAIDSLDAPPCPASYSPRAPPLVG